IPVLANDADVDGPALVIESFTQPQKGTVTNNGNGTLRFAPHASFLSGEDSFAYTVSDGAGGSATATVHVAVGLLAAGPWAMMGRDAAHTGHYPGWLGAETFSQAWTVQVAQQPLHQVVIGEGKVFAAPDIIPGKETQISAVDLMYGAVAWKKVFPQANTLTGPAYHNGSVYLQRSNGSGDSQLFAVAAADGGTRWSTAFATQGEKYKSPTVTDTSVFTPGGNSGGLLGYNRTTGAQAFFTSLSAMAQWTPALDGEFVYTCTGGTFRQHHAATGATLWSLNVGSGNALTPVIGAGSGFIIPNGTSPHHLVCVNLATKSVRWRVQTGFAGTPAVAGSFVYAYDAAGNVSAFNVADGSLARSYVTGLGAGAGLGGLSGNQPIVTNDVLIAASATTTVIHSLSTGAKLQTINAGGWPSLSNGYLLLAGTDGVLRSYTLMGNNIAPLAQNQTVTCVEDQTVTVTLPGTDANGDPLSALITALPAKGVLYQTTDGVQIGAPITLLPAIVSNPQRMVIYRPEADGFGTAYATFKFRTTDGRASSAEATTTINVASVNDAPVAVDDAVYLRAGTLLDGYVPTGNDTDADGESLVVFATTAPAKGELTKNADGSLRYVPQEGFIEGTDSFEYTLRDGAGLTSSATVTLLVSEAYGREWTQFGNGADHPRRYPVLLGTQAWVQRWEYSYPAAINAAAVAAGRVYVTPAGGVGSAAYVSALDAATGGELWRAQMPNGRANPPSYHGETVFTQRCNTSSDSQLWALNADDGSLKWSNSHSMQSGRYLS
ncbi:MAG TPA: tandem-95 repeat protein, partial [Prosthecobacter sp.]|nr:tandem-95 repeat protein [Prosthecobacter sp.]